MGDTSSSAGSVKSDGGSSADSPMSTVADVTVPRDVLLSMNEYMTAVNNLVESGLLWEKATGLIITGGKSKPFLPCNIHYSAQRSLASIRPSVCLSIL